jgi:hypothetical protein
LLGGFHEQPRKPMVSFAVHKKQRMNYILLLVVCDCQENLIFLGGSIFAAKILVAKVNPVWSSGVQNM